MNDHISFLIEKLPVLLFGFSGQRPGGLFLSLILAVLAVPALLAQQEIEVAVLWRDYGLMVALTALLILFAYGIGSRKIITRFEGAVLVTGWVGYTYLIYHQ